MYTWFQTDALVRLLPLIGSSSVRYFQNKLVDSLMHFGNLLISFNCVAPLACWASRASLRHSLKRPYSEDFLWCPWQNGMASQSLLPYFILWKYFLLVLQFHNLFYVLYSFLSSLWVSWEIMCCQTIMLQRRRNIQPISFFIYLRCWTWILGFFVCYPVIISISFCFPWKKGRAQRIPIN